MKYPLILIPMSEDLNVNGTTTKPKTVMVVEDDLATQAIILKVLDKIPYATLYASVNNGAAALKYLNEAEVMPDLVFMDTNMPVMDGIECLGEMLNNRKLRKIPVVMLSNGTDKADIAKYLGAKAYIKKPYDHMELQDRLEAMISLDLSVPNYTADLSFQMASGTY